MVIDDSQVGIFRTGSDFEQIIFLDNFFEKIDLEHSRSQKLTVLLQQALKSKNNYIRRSAFKIFCDLTLASIIDNPYLALAELHNFLTDDDTTLQTIAIKYLPYFPELHTNFVTEQLKELSDSVNGDVASQAYFCLGLFQLTESTSHSNVIEVTSCLEKSKIHFQSANQSIENRVDAEFYLLVIRWLRLVLRNDAEAALTTFTKIEESLLIRNLYDFDIKGFELDFLVFQLVTKTRSNFTTSSEADRWLDVRKEAFALLESYQALRKVKDSANASTYLIKQISSNVFETIESGIYQAHLSSNKERLKALHIQEKEPLVVEYLCYLISNLPEDAQSNNDNSELLALLSEMEGSEYGMVRYNALSSKNAAPEVIDEFRRLFRKNKSQSFPRITGTVQGEEVYIELKKKIQRYLPNYPEDKLEAYFVIVEEVIRYARETIVGNDRKRFPFLYPQTESFPTGKGPVAKEQDLQDSMLHFFDHSKVKDGLEHEKARFVDGGRVDIVYKKDIITVPIELKRSLKRPSMEDLEQKYIAQAQTYTAGYDQVGIFVLLELSDKTKEPPPNFKDWFNVHSLPASTNLDVNFPDCVISVVIPGNKTSPSSKSTYT